MARLPRFDRSLRYLWRGKIEEKLTLQRGPRNGGGERLGRPTLVRYLIAARTTPRRAREKGKYLPSTDSPRPNGSLAGGQSAR
jgi:hypothetical protein